MYAQIPILLLEWSILSFLVGLRLWYWSLPRRSAVVFWIITAEMLLMYTLFTLVRGGTKGRSGKYGLVVGVDLTLSWPSWYRAAVDVSQAVF